MDFFDALKMVGGLAVFIYGMEEMGRGLKRLGGGKLEQILSSLTNNKWKAVALGTLVTAAIQSSSATTVMTVGLVNAGLIKLSQAIGVIMGANVGTTVTAWLLSLVGIEGGSFFVRMLKPESFTPILALIGVIMLTQAKQQKSQYIGQILLGFSVLMIGMETMSSSMKPLAGDPAFRNLMVSFNQPILGFLVGLVVTAIIQSSSAAIGILQALSVSGSLLNSRCLPIILGINVGTCATSLLASIGTGINAKRTAIVHLLIKSIAALSFLTLYLLFSSYIADFSAKTANFLSIAVMHTVFNIAGTAVLINFTDGLKNLACHIIKGDDPDDELEKEFAPLDSSFLDNPNFAMQMARSISNKMADYAVDSIIKAIDLLFEFKPEVADEVDRIEDLCDKYEDKLGSFLVRLTSQSLSDEESQALSRVLYNLSDFERISDHAVNIADAAREMKEKDLSFSDAAEAELRIFCNALKEILETAKLAYQENDLQMAGIIEPIEETIDDLADSLKSRHINRLRKGVCTIEMGFVLSDIITALERVSDHCSNIGASITEISLQSFDTHQYVQNLKKNDKEFAKLYEAYRHKYILPPEQNGANSEKTPPLLRQSTA